MFWLAHQRAFVYIERYDTGLARLSCLLLLLTVFIPFPTALLDAYGDHLVAVIFYAVVMSISGILLTALRLYISHNHRLLAKEVSSQFIQANTQRGLSMPIVFLASIGVAFASIAAAEAMWILGLGVHFWLGALTPVA